MQGREGNLPNTARNKAFRDKFSAKLKEKGLWIGHMVFLKAFPDAKAQKWLIRVRKYGLDRANHRTIPYLAKLSEILGVDDWWGDGSTEMPTTPITTTPNETATPAKESEGAFRFRKMFERLADNRESPRAFEVARDIMAKLKEWEATIREIEDE